MSLLIKKPLPELCKYIHQYTGLMLDVNQKSKLFPNGSFRVPNSIIRIAFHFTDNVPWIEFGNQKLSQARQHVRGYQLHPITFNTNHSIDVLTIEFTPYGFYNIFGIPCSELTLAPINLESILYEEHQLLLNELYALSSFLQRVKFLDSYFLKKISPNQELDRAHIIDQLICQSEFHLNVKDLAQHTFTTERTLRRFFLKHFGVSPKSFIKFKRFEKTIKEINVSNNNLWLNTALKFGYYDQAHFINEFKNYMRMTPKEFKKA